MVIKTGKAVFKDGTEMAFLFDARTDTIVSRALWRDARECADRRSPQVLGRGPVAAFNESEAEAVMLFPYAEDCEEENGNPIVEGYEALASRAGLWLVGEMDLDRLWDAEKDTRADRLQTLIDEFRFGTQPPLVVSRFFAYPDGWLCAYLNGFEDTDERFWRQPGGEWFPTDPDGLEQMARQLHRRSAGKFIGEACCFLAAYELALEIASAKDEPSPEGQKPRRI
ncbi:hypothetical protein [Caballeronia sp. BCC1704]|uniref:hypothetical protein n=1 Tax=Caballeronia sp. BCC1704 TaxID=2676300 RepID=UPI00158C76D6|nr:hypothetical protein [Caballeronia sp. BCC1704]